jgi:hypothetical protein
MAMVDGNVITELAKADGASSLLSNHELIELLMPK